MLRKPMWTAVLFAAPISLAAVATTVYFLIQLTSPCVGWGGGHFYGRVGAEHPCRQYTVDSRTRSQAALTMVAVQGVILTAAALGIWGTIRTRQQAVALAGILMLLEMIPTIFSFAPLALLAGIGFLVIAHRMEKSGIASP